MSVDLKSGLTTRKEVNFLYGNFAVFGGFGALGIGAFAATDAKILPIWVSVPGMALVLSVVILRNVFRRRKEAIDAGVVRKTNKSR